MLRGWLQKLLDEHMRLMYGMDHVPTIQMAFSDNQDANGKIAKVPSNGDSAAFFNQLQAAARQVDPCPAVLVFKGFTFWNESILPSRRQTAVAICFAR